MSGLESQDQDQTNKRKMPSIKTLETVGVIVYFWRKWQFYGQPKEMQMKSKANKAGCLLGKLHNKNQQHPELKKSSRKNK